MPTAPSKLFRITEHVFYDSEEIKQIKQLDYAHQAQMDSIKAYMEEKFYIPSTQSGGIPQEFIDQETKKDEKIYAENDKINAEIAKEREEFFANMIAQMEEQVMEEKLATEERLIETAEKIDEYVKKTKDDPESFVTPDNFEYMLNKAIENPKSYEFCIDRAGRIYGQNQDKSTSNEKSDTPKTPPTMS